MRLTTLVTSLAAAMALLVPSVGAHGLPDSYNVKQPFNVLLVDVTDDCGPEAVAPGVSNTNDCHGADALIGLALQEKWDGSRDQLVFRFLLDVGKTGPFTDTLTLNTPAGAKTLSIKSTDDQSFSNNGGFDSVGGKQGLAGEKTRFTIDATVSREHLGLKVGDALTNFVVKSYSGPNEGDDMPGGCHNTVGSCSSSTTGQRVYGNGNGNYPLQGPTYYTQFSGPSGTQTAVNGKDLDTPLMLNLRNQFPQVAQVVTLTLDGADGVTAGFHSGDPAGATYKPTLDVKLEGDAGTVLHLNLHGDRIGATGTLTVTATTDQGGRMQIQVPYEVKDSAAATTGTGASTGDTTSKHSPASAAPLLCLLLLGLALRRRA